MPRLGARGDRPVVADTVRSVEGEADVRDQPPVPRAGNATVKGTDRPQAELQLRRFTAAKRRYDAQVTGAVRIEVQLRPRVEIDRRLSCHVQIIRLAPDWPFASARESQARQRTFSINARKPVPAPLRAQSDLATTSTTLPPCLS